MKSRITLNVNVVRKHNHNPGLIMTSARLRNLMRKNLNTPKVTTLQQFPWRIRPYTEKKHEGVVTFCLTYATESLQTRC